MNRVFLIAEKGIFSRRPEKRSVYITIVLINVNVKISNVVVAGF